MMWSQPITIYVATQTVVNFKPVVTLVDTPGSAMVVPAQLEALQKGLIDYSLNYIDVAGSFPIAVDDYIGYKGKMYKAIQMKNAGDYGFYQATYEEVK
jgi:hypothetical protein